MTENQKTALKNGGKAVLGGVKVLLVGKKPKAPPEPKIQRHTGVIARIGMKDRSYSESRSLWVILFEGQSELAIAWAYGGVATDLALSSAGDRVEIELIQEFGPSLEAEENRWRVLEFKNETLSALRHKDGER